MNDAKPWLVLLVAFGLLVAWALRAEDSPPPSLKTLKMLGIGSDLGEVAACGQCHLGIAKDWGRPTSHALLYACSQCHAQAGDAGGKGHQTSKACGACHSETSHPPAATCATCHRVHGTGNLQLLADAIATPLGVTAVNLQSYQGVAADGLAHAGQGSGPGICETCHISTKVFRRDGKGDSHPTAWCGTCHDHGAGFKASAL
ncbi:MAG: hypothetical protein HY902_04560 [Deltaproteobacteria bacterium]|nr:hypothetical protein [Deltaproteobacteria bacterium]